MRQILWIGCLESDEEFQIKAKKGHSLAAPQVSQKSLVSGIEIICNISMDSINGSVLPPYPHYRDRIIEPVVWHHNYDSYDISVGYKNDKYINRVNCKKSMLEAAHEWVRNRYKGGELVVFAYSMRSAPMATACLIKKLIPSARLYLLVTDLPQYMDLGQSRLKAFLKRIDWVSIKRMQSKFDGFILYAAKMAEYLRVPNNKWILMEGSFDKPKTYNSMESNVSNNLKVVMYSGRLNREYGIELLLDAFMKIDDNNIELWLTGGGNAVKYIKTCAAKDKRIKFYGFLPTRNDVLKLQSQAAALINMRLPSEPASAYCFPSKLFEYMATGKPVVSFKLQGIPKEYMDYLIPIEGESEKDIQNAIRKVLSMTEQEIVTLGHSAQDFILKKKNTEVQCKSVSEFVGLLKKGIYNA